MAVGRRGWRAVAVTLLALLLAGCATFPDNGPRDWKEKLENAGELGGPPVVPQPSTPPPTPEQGGNQGYAQEDQLQGRGHG